MTSPSRFVQFARHHWLDILIVGVGLLLRLLWLGLKPAHFDEGVNGWFIDQMTQIGYFNYDPDNYHGPLHFYVLFIAQTLFGRSVVVLRIPIVIVSTLSLLLALRFDRFFGKPTARLAAAAMAVSPAFVFYGRYAIHEAWLVLFLMIAVYGIFALLSDGNRQALWVTALGLTGMVLTKETYLLHFVALLATWGCCQFYQRLVPSQPLPVIPRQSWTLRDLLRTCAVALSVLVLFYSGLFRDWPGLLDPFHTFATWFATGSDGNGHEKPFFYWIKLLWSYEWLVLLGLIGCLRFLWPSAHLLRFLVIYAAGTLLIYSVIPYKTPWCGITIFWPFFFITMALAVEAWQKAIPWLRATTVVVLSIATIHSIHAMVRVNFIRFTTDQEPYVYVQTHEDLRRFTRPLLELARQNPAHYHQRGIIQLDSYYPLPWQLADFTAISWPKPSDPPTAPIDAAFLLIRADQAHVVEPLLTQAYFSETIRLRSAQEDCKYYLRADLFQPVFPERTPEFTPSTPLQ